MRDCFPTVHSVSCGPVTTLWRGSHTAQWVLLIMVSCLYISFLMLPFSVNKLSFPYLRTKLSTNLNIVNACDLKSRVADSGLIDRPPGVWFSEQFSVTLLHLLAAVFSALCSSCCLPPAIFSVVRGILKRLTWRGDSCPFRMTHVSVSRKFIYYLTMYPCVPKQVGVCPSSLQSYKKLWSIMQYRLLQLYCGPGANNGKIWVLVYVHECKCMFEDHRLTSLSQLIFWDSVSHWTWSSLIWLDWKAASPRDSPDSASSAVRLQAWATTPRILYRCWRSQFRS